MQLSETAAPHWQFLLLRLFSIFKAFKFMDSDCDMFPSVCSCHAYVYASVLATGTIRPLDTLLNQFEHVPGCPLAPKV